MYYYFILKLRILLHMTVWKKKRERNFSLSVKNFLQLQLCFLNVDRLRLWWWRTLNVTPGKMVSNEQNQQLELVYFKKIFVKLDKIQQVWCHILFITGTPNSFKIHTNYTCGFLSIARVSKAYWYCIHRQCQNDSRNTISCICTSGTNTVSVH